MANDSSNGLPTIFAALILGLSLAGGAYMVSQSLDRSSERLSSVLTAITELKVAQAPAPAPTRAPSRPGRPDPTKVYPVSLGQAPVKGPESAEITIVEWSDFQCPFCRRAGPTMDQIQEEYGEKVRIAFKHMPLSIHSKARGAHAASEAAHIQGKFWEMHDKLFADQRGLSEENYIKYATELGLDVEQFEKDMKSAKVQARLDADMAEASKLGVTGTPAFFVNGRFLSGAQPFASFKRLIDEELQKKG